MEISGDIQYKLPVHINDEDLYCETSIKKKDFDIIFKSVTGGSKPKGDIFSKTTKQTSLATSVEKGNLIIDLNISKLTSYNHFINIIAGVLHIHISCLKIDEKVLHENDESEELINSKTVIGDHEFTFKVTSSSKPRENGYINISLPIVQKIYNNTVTSTNKYKVNPRISEIQYCLYDESVKDIDIVRLMNINNATDLFARIYLHSFKLNDFNDEYSNAKSYIKTKIATSAPWFGIDCYKDVCTFYYNKEISDKDNFIRLHQINVFQNGIISLTFKNLDFDYPFEKLDTIVNNYINGSFKDILKSIHIEECVYSQKLPTFKSVFLCCNISVTLNAKTKMSQIHFINSIPGFKSVYSMFTSERSFGPQEFGRSAELLMHRTHNITVYYQETLLNYNYALLIQVNQADNKTIISINNLTNFNFGMILTGMLMNKINTVDKHEKPHAKTTDDIMDYLCSVDSKLRLKFLKDADPTLFGIRNINGKPNSYSQVVQKDVQRPSVIGINDYEIIKKDKPDSVLDLKNQTTGERIYLVCPFKEAPIINMHGIPNQMCIVKCTVTFSNENQFYICDASLGGSNVKTKENIFSSTSITKYNPNIDVGRRCLCPNELTNVFPKCYLLKLPANNLIQAYVGQRYGLRTFIIDRCDGYFNILTEYVYPNEYGIVLHEEGSNNYMIICELETKRPFIMKHDSDSSFIQQLIKTSMYRHDVSYVIKYINNICKTDFDLSMKLMDFVKAIGEKLNVKFINKKDDVSIIIGMIYDNHIYFIPHFFNLGFTSVNIRYLLMEKKIKEHYPKLTDLDQSGIDKLYIDFNNQDVIAVKYYGINTLIMPTNKTINCEIEYVDYQPFIFTLFGLSIKPIAKPTTETSIIHINDLLKLYIKIAMIQGVNLTFETISELFKNNISDKNELVFINNEISWRQSKINRRLLKNINFNKQSIMKLIYENISSEYSVKHLATQEYLYSADIGNN